MDHLGLYCIQLVLLRPLYCEQVVSQPFYYVGHHDVMINSGLLILSFVNGDGLI